MRGARTVGEIASSRGVNSPPIAQKGEHPRLIENTPVPDAVTERASDDFRILGETARQVAIGPAAGIFQFLRQVPMIERAKRADFRLEELIGKPLVIIQAFGVGFAGAVGLDARPGNGKAV